MRLLKRAFKLGIVLLMFVISYFNYALLYTPKFRSTDTYTYNASVYHQLQFLKTELRSGSSDDMQNLYPEGLIFLNAIYALSWKELIEDIPADSPIFEEGIREINRSWKLINSDKGKYIFDASLPLTYGVFYSGWNNYVLGSKLMIEHTATRDSSQIELFKNTCEAIAVQIEQANYPYLESYNNGSWPADNFVAMASLVVHDKIFAPKYEQAIKDWISAVKEELDPVTGLIPHQVNAREQVLIEGARGSSQSLILNFLYEIDQSFGALQFQQFKSLFLDRRFGLYGVREYPFGTVGKGDIDSGPVILEIGGAASIVGQSTLQKFGALSEARSIRNSIEAFGMPFTIQSKKRFLFGQLAIADAFICWSNSIEKTPTKVSSNHWRLFIQLLSFLILIIGVILLRT